MKRVVFMTASIAFCFGIATASNSAELCFNKPTKDWLPGEWSIGKSTWVFEQDGESFSWTWVRGEGQMTKKWGKKKTAKGEGKVTSIDGCSLRMDGEYTSYDGSTSGHAIGHEIIYKMEALAEDLMVGTGYGLGKSEYRFRMRK